MGWNGSNSGSSAVVKDGGRKPSAKAAPSFKKGIIAGLVVVIGAGVVFWYIGSKDTSKPTKEKKAATKQIAEVKPQIVTQAVEVAEQKVADEPVLTPEEEKRAKEKAERIAVIKRRQMKLSASVGNDTRPAAPYAIFNHPSENRIAELLTIEPGTPILLPPHFSERFEEDFKESCKEPIVVSADDSEYEQQLKRDMIDCKIELCNRMAEGEKLGDILSDAHRELRKLGEIKSEISRTMRNEIRANARTQEEVDDYIAAANKMLEAKGIAPIQGNPVLRRSLQRAALRNAAEVN